MRKVYKYEMPFNNWVTLKLPEGARILRVAEHNNVLCIWALINPEAKIVERLFRWAGTGHEIKIDENNLWHIGTVVLFGNEEVYHLFEINPILPQHEQYMNLPFGHREL